MVVCIYNHLIGCIYSIYIEKPKSKRSLSQSTTYTKKYIVFQQVQPPNQNPTPSKLGSYHVQTTLTNTLSSQTQTLGARTKPTQPTLTSLNVKGGSLVTASVAVQNVMGGFGGFFFPGNSIHLPKGAKSFLKSVNSPSLRV